jgi:hypothetical protein
MDSSWYCDVAAHVTDMPFDESKPLMPVDQYVGGIERVGHHTQDSSKSCGILVCWISMSLSAASLTGVVYKDGKG